jgi:hypothetical protein
MSFNTFRKVTGARFTLATADHASGPELEVDSSCNALSYHHSLLHMPVLPLLMAWTNPLPAALLTYVTDSRATYKCCFCGNREQRNTARQI